jgi:LysM repeat protein
VDYPDAAAVVQRREQTIGPDTTTADSSAATLDDGMSIVIGENAAETRREMARISDELASRIDTTTYTVREGETLYSIARDLRTKVYILYTLNNGIYGVLEPGTSIVIPAAADGDASENMHVYAVGTVSVFPDSESGRTMAGGSAYDPDEYVVAHPELPFESILIVENPETGRATFARVADRGPSDSPHLMVVSPALASEIGADAGSGVQIRLVE